MEQHPVPQNISSFQFKLIGDITLKQFSYVAGGIICGYLIFKIGLLPTLLSAPLGLGAAIFGVGLAFFPIQERPLDRWLGAFIKSIYAPTQFVWKKQNLPPEILLSSAAMPMIAPPAPHTPPTLPVVVQPPKPPAPKPVVAVSPPRVIPPAPPKPPAPPPVARPTPAVAPIRPTLTPFKPTPPPKPDAWTIGAPPVRHDQEIVRVSPAPSVTGQRIVFEEPKKQTVPKTQVNTQQVEKLKNSYAELEKRLTTQMQAMQLEMQQGNITKERFMELQQLLTQLLSEKDRMSQELAELRKQLAEKEKSSVVRPTQYKTMPQEMTSTVKIVPQNMAMKVGMPQLTTYPNVVTGLVKDSQGILLPNLILTVKDREGMPVRALKTNKLGQFAASTPLANGTYVIEVEDPSKKFHFERIEVTLTSQVLPPLEISAISEKDTMRQKLAQEIFGGNKI